MAYENRTVQRGRVLDTVEALFDRPIADAPVEAGDQVGSLRPIAIQVRDRHAVIWKGRWLVLVLISATEGGDPDGTGNAVVVTTGFMVQEFIAGAAYLILTDADGLLALTLTVSGAGDRFIRTSVYHQMRVSDRIEYV